MNSHLDDERLIGYSHSTLTDAEREEMDGHLVKCPDCRTRLTGHEMVQRHVRHSLLADLRTAQPPADMTFSAIAPRVSARGRFAGLWRQSDQLLRGAAVATPPCTELFR